MNLHEQWLRDYALLALRIDKVMRATTELPYVDGYYGPAEWKAIIEATPTMDVADLLRSSIALAETLPISAFEPRRAARLRKLVKAMETVCRKLSGESLALEEEIAGYFDFRPTWVSETLFEEALETGDELLPGKGSLAERWHNWHAQFQPSPDHIHLLLDVAQRMLAEARRRTLALMRLPESEHVDLRAVSDVPFSAANFYQGDYQTVIELNTDLPFNILELIDTTCHEVYPGHHTECILKDQHLYRERGYVEHSVPIVLSPPCLISEGIAMSAMDMLFTSDELEQWLRAEIYPLLSLAPDPVDILALRAAGDVLGGAQCNAVFMLRDGRPDKEIREYLTRYLQPAGLLRHASIPFFDSYVCSYFYGKRLLAPHLQGADRQALFRRFLTEPVFASELAGSDTYSGQGNRK